MEWLDNNTQSDDMWLGSSLCVSHRYAKDLADDMREEGFTLE
jgi:hypothetical protein